MPDVVDPNPHGSNLARELAGINLKDSALFLQAPPHGLFARLRRDAPVHWNATPDGPGFWNVTRYTDVMRVSTDAATFSSARKNGGHRIFDEYEVASDQTAPSMISMDPPEHLVHRRIVMPGFTPNHLQALETGIRARAQRLAEALHDQLRKGDADFVDSFAAPMAIGTLADLLGLPEGDGDRLFQWSNAVVAEEDPELRPSLQAVHAMVKEMALYGEALRPGRRAGEGADLLTLMARADVDGAPLSSAAFLSAFILLVVAGNETSRNSMTGGLIALHEYPEQRAALMAEPGLLRSAVAEIIRWVSPVYHMRRTAMADTQIGDQAIRAGDRVVVWYVSANRDEQAFAEGQSFRVDRFAEASAPRHIAFGVGQHVCLGQRLAELQLRIAFEALFAVCPTLRPAGQGRRVLSNFINGWKSLPVQVAGPNA